MKKAWVLLLLALVVAVQLTVLSSFVSIFGFYSVSGTSAVVVGKTNYVSMKVTFSVFANNDSPVVIVFPNGTQTQVIVHHIFQVFLPKTEPVHSPGSFRMSRAEEGVFITDQEPIDVAVVSEVDEDFFTNKVGPHPSGEVILYWFKIQGDAQVSVTVRGVTL
jgi:hypothetical protein